MFGFATVPSLFPDLLDFWFVVVPVLLRLSAGIVFLYFGIQLFRDGKEKVLAFVPLEKRGTSSTLLSLLAVLFMVSGILLLLGLYTQGAALLLSLLSLIISLVGFSKKTAFQVDALVFLLLFVICLSLVFTGAGILAFDIRL